MEMEKNEYVSPKVEIVEITEQSNILLSGSSGADDEIGGGFDSGYLPDDF